MKRKTWIIFAATVVLTLSAYARGQQDGMRVLPDSFLRGYDPITVVFGRDTGPPEGGSFDNPAKLVSISPFHPGEYRWLDSRTLQFLPTVPWPALRVYELRGEGISISLFSMMKPPVKVWPRDGSSRLEPLKTIILSFSDPLNIEDLSQMLSLEVKSLPGVGKGDCIWLTEKDFTIKELDRPNNRDPVQYRITLKEPIDYGRHITLHIRLSLSDKINGSVAQYRFMTKPEFRLSSFGSGYTRYPVAGSGSVYSTEQAINCGTGSTPLFLEFTENISSLDIETVKRLVKFEPAVNNFRYNVSGNRISLYFDAEREEPYKLSVVHQPITSRSGRKLTELGHTSLFFYYRQLSPYLRWKGGQAIVERFGPQFFPMEARSTGQLDLRIYKIDPLSRNFWPFPSNPVVIDESTRPKMSGEEPEYGTQLAEQIRLIGSPLVSRIMNLPDNASHGHIRFGLNVKPFLEKISGTDKSGSYLVGYRELGASSKRHYVRLAVTDLSLSTIEEEHAVVFVVTSLKTARPIAGAGISIEADDEGKWKQVIIGVTDKEGKFRYEHKSAIKETIKRIVVSYNDDILVLDPLRPPPHFQNNHWFGSSSNWLAWLNRSPRQEQEKARERAYIFTERPIYRPEEPVHIMGFLRLVQQGKILPAEPSRPRTIGISGPGRKYWSYPVTLKRSGQFYVKFQEEDMPTGQYTAVIRDEELGRDLASVSFKKESYRIPRFEINVSGPDSVPLDRPFELVLTADYYAGGRVVGQQVSWDITQYLYHIHPPAFPGYVFSTEDRFSGGRPFRASGSSRKMDTTDENGSASLRINPALEEDGRPRRYIVEATLRGADTQTVTAVMQVLALPPFILGLKLDRFLKDGKLIKPEILVLDHQENPLSGMNLKLRLYQRQWHSYLKETDFTTGDAEYVTDVVDEIIYEKNIISGDGPISPELPVEQGGVYVVEILAKDALGRLQRVQSDLYVSGDTPVAWKKTDANVFQTSMDKKRYQTGDTAQILLQSPFQTARALVILEAPEANEYNWVDIQNGQGFFSFPVTNAMARRVPVHVLLIRGRLEGTAHRGGREDLGKPVAVANTTWVQVDPVENQAVLSIDHASRHLPGSRMNIKLHLKDPDGTPLDGEVTLWLVDRAVLALGVEKSLDPLSAFIDPRRAHVRLRETRNQVVGNLPIEEIPGGADAAAKAARLSLLDKTTVRRNFQTVPYFNPMIEVKRGEAEIFVDLPDNLTDFSIRAVAVSGHSRFGSAKSVVSIRLPVIVQSALPRFVRPGDSFVAGGIARIVEGEASAGRFQIEVEGLKLEQGRSTLSDVLKWEKKKPVRLFFPLHAPKELSRLDAENVVVRLAVERNIDQAVDAFELKLPIKRDTEQRRLDLFTSLSPGKTVSFPKPSERVRPGTLRQSLVITDEPAIIRLIAGMKFLGAYEHECTEQNISKVYPLIALEGLFKRIGLSGQYQIDKTDMKNLFTYLDSTLCSNGLYGFWPGSRGYVGLTAYVVEFLVLARKNGFYFKDELLERPLASLKEALRSDYKHFVPGYVFRERVEALSALAAAGYFDEAYSQDLLVGALTSNLYSQAKILYLFLEQRRTEHKAVSRLENSLWQSTVFKLQDDKEQFAGLQYRKGVWGGLVLSSKVKTNAGVTRALYRADPENPRIRLMLDDLVDRGTSDGWGSTQANTAALLAIDEVLRLHSPDDNDRSDQSVEIKFGTKLERLQTGAKPVTVYHSSENIPGTVRLIKGSESTNVWLSAEYISDELGDSIEAESKGFSVQRELLKIDSENHLVSKHSVKAGQILGFDIDTIIEEHISIFNSENRNFVALRIPFAAGFEPMNPELATSPKEASPAGKLTRKPTYTLYEDDQVTFYYESLPKGNYDFFFRVRASFAGSYTHPPARAELMYDSSVKGRSSGTRIEIHGK